MQSFLLRWVHSPVGCIGVPAWPARAWSGCSVFHSPWLKLCYCASIGHSGGAEPKCKSRKYIEWLHEASMRRPSDSDQNTNRCPCHVWHRFLSSIFSHLTSSLIHAHDTAILTFQHDIVHTDSTTTPVCPHDFVPVQHPLTYPSTAGSFIPNLLNSNLRRVFRWNSLLACPNTPNRGRPDTRGYLRRCSQAFVRCYGLFDCLCWFVRSVQLAVLAGL